MGFLNLINKRQSVRKYIDKPIESEKLMRCLDAARLAPSASNSQPWKFIVVDNPELKNKVARETFSPLVNFNKFTLDSPILIAITLEKPPVITRLGGRLKKRSWKLMDLGMAAEHFCLQAEEEGLGTCMIGWYNEKEIKDLLSIPKDKDLSLLISLGYAPEGYKLRQKSRKSIDEMTSFNKY
jgi:nitroreductase